MLRHGSNPLPSRIALGKAGLLGHRHGSYRLLNDSLLMLRLCRSDGFHCRFKRQVIHTEILVGAKGRRNEIDVRQIEGLVRIDSGLALGQAQGRSGVFLDGNFTMRRSAHKPTLPAPKGAQRSQRSKRLLESAACRWCPRFCLVNALLKRTFCALLNAFLYPACQAADSGDVHEKITNAVSRGAVGAAVFGLYNKGDVKVHGFGHIRPGESQKPDGETLFEIGSITKVFTVLLAQRLAEQGKLDWDQPISSYFTELPFENESVGAITLRSLAAHSSGLPRLPENFSPSDSLDPYADYDRSDLSAFLSSFDPDSLSNEYAYSNLGFGLLGIHCGRCCGQGLPGCDRGIHPCAVGYDAIIRGLPAAKGFEHGFRLQ